jgi:hypothetical protein
MDEKPISEEKPHIDRKNASGMNANPTGLLTDANGLGKLSTREAGTPSIPPHLTRKGIGDATPFGESKLKTLSKTDRYTGAAKLPSRDATSDCFDAIGALLETSEAPTSRLKQRAAKNNQ